MFARGSDFSAGSRDLAKSLGLVSEHGVRVKDSFAILEAHLKSMGVEMGKTADETILNLTTSLEHATEASTDFKLPDIPDASAAMEKYEDGAKGNR